MIPQHITRQFSGSSRSRGEEYAAQGRVRLEQLDSGHVHAIVRGTKSYDVDISFGGQGRGWSMLCTCPAWEDYGPCKHLWAALLAADRRGLLDRGVGHDVTGPPEHKPVTPIWKERLRSVLRDPGARGIEPRKAEWPADHVIDYVIPVDELFRTGSVAVVVSAEPASTSSRSGRPTLFTLDDWLRVPEPIDRQIAHMLLGARPAYAYPSDPAARHRFVVPPAMYDATLRLICETGRCRLVADTLPVPGTPVRWDAAPPFTLRLRIVRAPGGGGWQLEGNLVRAGEELALDDIVVLTSAGLVFRESCISRFDSGRAWPILPLLREPEPLVVPDADLFALAAELHLMPNAPPIELPQNFRIEEAHPVPVPCLRVRRADDDRFAYGQLPVELGFDYDGMVVGGRKSGRAIVQHEPPRLIHRDPELERAARNRLIELGARELYDWRHTRPRLGIAPKQLDAVVATLTAEGWRVEADGRRFRAASRTQVNVSSGIDWFELQGAIEFGDQVASLPRLLAALRNGEKTVLLDDGTYGLLPVEWLQRFAGVAGLAAAGENASAMRFTIAQTSLLDALLATLPEPRVDETFARIRDELRRFEAITPVAAPESFCGELRHYQQEGLGWIEFLRRFGLGGCLADDMGLGKTVQVLALLEQCRAAGKGPSLVVVPKSLVFNWRREAERFTPAVRVRDYTGGQRHREPLDPASFDVLLTTYGTLRRDAPHLRALEFEYVILDEAQAIKNAKTASAKAALLLRGRNRLGLSGTPIENRLEELWSLFEFLNPGMLGASTAFATLKNLSGNGNVPEGRAMLARALRPFILRRTKEQVAPELPPRVEQTLIVELEKEQRALYDELRVHYRHALLARIDKIGIKRAQIEILEALLRLRQAACHPGLIDARHARAGSAKLDVLLAQLEEIVAEGHRALVFSQFTSFLALVRERLDAKGIVYEYLDGKTRDREARVQRFQTDAQCPVFLISLRAGGHGLNLTAADYVFVLDPWWNPAVEAQAIDRTHRIGQQRHVFALRLIARDTVEEKVLELQQQKRELADAILNADAGGLSAIGREELERLLG